MVRPDWRWDGDKRRILYIDDKPVVEIRKESGIKVLGNHPDVPVMIWRLYDASGPLQLSYSGVLSFVWRTSKPDAQRAAEQWARGVTPARCV